MPLENRVTPFGEIVALPGRGLMMGNRGVLHDDDQRIVRSWQVRRWIACRLSFRGRHRGVMQPHRYTELFFLDEATALSAGHRPCAECRHADYQRFRSFWQAIYGSEVNADAIDARLHADRLVSGRKRTFRAHLAHLPRGSYVSLDGKAWLISEDELLLWSDSGYTSRRPRPLRSEVEVLTPRAMVGVLSAGYRPEMHPSAQ